MTETTTTSPAPFTTAEFEAWVGFLRVHARLVRELDAELERSHGLTLAEYDVLVQLDNAPERRLRMADLADAVVLTRSGLTRLVDRLQRRGLVERARCPSDARGMNAQLTDAGAAMLREAAGAHREGVRRRFLDELHASELASLAEMWERLGGAPGDTSCG